MQVTELESKGLKREYSILIDANTINQRIDARLKTMGSRIKVPGFRPGNVPMKVLQQRYGKSVTAEVIEQIVNNASKDAMEMKKLRPALPAQIEITDYQEGGELQFKMKLEILPEIPDTDFSKVSLERLTFDIPDSDVTEGIERLASHHRSWNKVDGKAKQGHAVVIDFTGKKDGVPFEGGAAKKFTLELGSGQFIPGFEEQLIGAKAGDEVVVKVSFPEGYHKEDLAGQPAEFDVVVHEVMEPESAKVDDAFAKTMGFDSLDALKEAVKAQIGKDYEGIARNKLKKQLFDALEDLVSFEVPQGMVDLEFNSIWSRLKEARAQGDDSMDMTDEELEQEYKRIAERRVRLGLLLSDVSFKNKIDVAKEDLSRAVMDQARQFPGQERKVIEFYQQNPAQVEELKGPILEDKAVDFIIEKAKVKDRKVSLEELIESDDEDDAKPSKAKKTAAKPAKKAAEDKPAKAKAEKKPAAKKK